MKKQGKSEIKNIKNEPFNAKTPEAVRKNRERYDSLASYEDSLYNKRNEVISNLSEYKTKAETYSELPKDLSSDQLKSELLKVQQVHSEKMLKAWQDSLEKKIPGSSKIPINPKKEVTEDDLLQAINTNFSKPSQDQLPTDKNALFNEGKKELQHEHLDEGIKGLNLSEVKLPDNELAQLEPLRGKMVDANSKYLKKIDSIRAINLKNQGLNLAEKTISENSKVALLETKPRFWDKTYFEGIITIPDPSLKAFQVSPSLGYHFLKRFSFGLGPNLQFQQAQGNANNKFAATIGLRTFIKSDFFNRRTYVQIEDNTSPVALTETKAMVSGHQVMVGGGVLVPISEKISLNFSLLYQVNEQEVKYQYDNPISPWLFRLGISSIQLKKKGVDRLKRKGSELQNDHANKIK